MPQAKIVYEIYGRLAADGKNAALIAHGCTSISRSRGQSGKRQSAELAGRADRIHAKWSPVLRQFLEPLMAKSG